MERGVLAPKTAEDDVLKLTAQVTLLALDRHDDRAG